MIAFGKALTAASLLVAAVTLMIVSTTDQHAELARWSVLVAMFGCTLTVTAVIDVVVRHTITEALEGERRRTEKAIRRAIADERERTEKVISGVAAEFAASEVARRLHSVARDDADV